MNFKAPLVSVLMTAYNRENFISEAIESVLSSTYTNFELIIVDDRSKDKTYEVSKSYEIKDARVKVYLNENNLGDYPNRNKAASYAKGKYIKYVDCDDKIYPQCLEMMVKAMEQYAQAALGLCKDQGTKPEMLEPEEAYLSPLGILNHNGPTGSIIVTNRFFEMGTFKNLVTVSDWDMWYRLAARWPVVALPAELILWRDHPDNTLKSDSHWIGTIQHYLRLKVDILSSEKCPISKPVVRKWLRHHNKEILLTTLKLTVSKRNLKYIYLYIKYNWRYFKYF